MDYKPNLPKKNHNVSHQNPFQEFLLLSVGALVVIATLYFILGLFVDRAVGYLSPEREAELFSKMTWSDSSTVLTPEQKETQDDLQILLDRVRTCIDISYPVSLSFVPSSDLNAMAYPGGKIIVLSGLLEQNLSENGLAFVLAHELAHFKNRDHLRGLGRSLVIASLSALLLGGSSDISQALAPTLSLREAQYSQGRESEADYLALGALNCLYGHVGGATELFQRLAAFEKRSALSPLGYFSTHPRSDNRIAALEQQAKERGFYMGEVIPR